MALSAPTSPFDTFGKLQIESPLTPNLNGEISPDRYYIRPVPDMRYLAPLRLQKCVHDADSAIRDGTRGPHLVEDSVGGTYLLRSSRGQILGVFKPSDEEPFAKNNPKGYNGSHIDQRAGIRPGESALREVAAYLLDRQESFIGVPQTALVESSHPRYFADPIIDPVAQKPQRLSSPVSIPSRFPRQVPSSPSDPPLIMQAPHSYTDPSIRTSPPVEYVPFPPKVGSFQEYIEADETAADLSSTQFPRDTVHKIGLFDIRLMNPDRNDANLLVVQGSGSTKDVYHRRTVRAHTLDTATLEDSPASDGPFSANVCLVPIDHAYVLPACQVPHVLGSEWCWLSWPQAKLPFCEETLKYIMSLDGEADARMLAEELPQLPLECGHIIRVMTLFIQLAAKSGHTLYQIAMDACRSDDSDTPSVLEGLIQEAMMEVDVYMWETNWEEAEAQFLAQFAVYAEEYFQTSPIVGRPSWNEHSSAYREASEVSPMSATTTEPDFDIELQKTIVLRE